MTRITDQLDQAQEDLLRVSNGLPRILAAIHDALPGQPGAASYDTPVVGGHTTIKFCEVHEKERCPCGQETSYPSVSDPTGEAGSDVAQYGHPAVSSLKAIKRHVAAIAHHADALVREAAFWQSRPPTKAEQRETARQNLPGCDLHATAGLFTEREPGAGLITAAGGFILPKPMHLCGACRLRIYNTKRVPSRADLHYHHDNGRWPKMLEQNYRGEVA